MFALAIIFGSAVLLVVSMLALVQALVGTELEVARQAVLRRKTALSERDREMEESRSREAALLNQLTQVESSRQDLFSYVVKQEQVLDEFRKNCQPHNDGTPLA